MTAIGQTCEFEATSRSIVDRLRQDLTDVLSLAGGLGEPSILGGGEPVADATTKVLIRDCTQHPRAVLIVSAPAFPDLVARNQAAAEAARAGLGADLGSVIPEPQLSGDLDGRSYLLLPYFDPLSASRLRRMIQRRWLVPQLLEWLHRATRATLQVPTEVEVRRDFVHPLQSLASDDAIVATIRAAAKLAAARLETGSWAPRYVLTHDDLWVGNILLRGGSPLGRYRQQDRWPFVIIDWAGARVRGHAMYDLVRLTKSMGLRRRLTDELRSHCQILGCEVVDARGYLLAALGYLGMHLNQFPRERYVSTVASCWSWMETIES